MTQVGGGDAEGRGGPVDGLLGGTLVEGFAGISVVVWHALVPRGHAVVLLEGLLEPATLVQHALVHRAVHVTDVLDDGILHPGDVQPADDQAEELGREGGRQ